MPYASASDKLIEHLALLHGDEFQDAVSALLRTVFDDFQSIPPKPQGDGGLDGLSHGQRRAYLCYGLTQESIRNKSDTKLKNDICKKFRTDLEKLLEVGTQGRGKRKKYHHVRNVELESIHARTDSIEIIHCICNWFEHHGIVGSLNAYLDELRTHSSLRFVDKACRLVVEGPKQLVSRARVDELVLAKVQHLGFIEAIHGFDRTDPPILDRGELDDKFDALVEARPSRSAGVESLRMSYFSNWADCVLMMSKLDDDYPRELQSLERVITRAATRAYATCLTTEPRDAAKAIETVQDEIDSAISQTDLAKLSGDPRATIVERIIARLAGECPLDWRPETTEAENE